MSVPAVMMLLGLGIQALAIQPLAVETLAIQPLAVEALGVGRLAATFGILRRFQVTHFDVFFCLHIGSSVVVLFRFTGLCCATFTE
jgi:hypothetical protein